LDLVKEFDTPTLRAAPGQPEATTAD